VHIYSIYKAENLHNGKVYIGFDSNWPKRFNDHKRNYLKKSNTLFYNSLKKYGWDSFRWQVIYQSTDFDHCLNVMEPHFILEYNSLSEGYNMTPGGEGKKLGSFESTATRHKKSIAHKGMKQSLESIKKTQEGRKGYKHSKETKLKLSLARIGKPSWNKGLKGVQQSTRKGLKRPRCCCIVCHKEVDDSNISRWHKHN
jgi:group I intron endonuclease